MQDGKDKVITFLRLNDIRWRNIVVKVQPIKFAQLNIIIDDDIGPIPPAKRINIAAEAAKQLIITCTPNQKIVTIASNDLIIAQPTNQEVITSRSIQRIIAP